MTAGSEALGGPSRGTGLIDGQPVSFLNFGGGTFTWDADLVVEEAPLFVWVARDATGTLRRLDIPTVAGQGPLYSGRKAALADGKPLYGSYWRLYTVEVPEGAGVFAPSTSPDVRAALAQTPFLYGFTYAPEAEAAATAAEFSEWAGRVATNPTCFKSAEDIDPTNGTAGACAYLDSQAAIESMVRGDAITKTDILVTCPFISYEGVPVVDN